MIRPALAGMDRRKMEKCMLCPRACGVNRAQGQKGFCRVPGTVMVARAALHRWEEPCISGTNGSGDVFFSGCSLRCRFCQNRPVSRGETGTAVTVETLADCFLQLQREGACNLNLVTAAQYVPQVIRAWHLAKEAGFDLPVLYNSSGYESVETLRLLEGIVDIYLPDMKYRDESLAAAYSGAADYPARAAEAISEMVRQQPQPVFGADGLMKKGVIVRHLVLPGHVREAKAVLKYLYDRYGNTIYYSIMSQYTPMEAVKEDPLLSRKVTAREYERVLNYALDLGIENGFFQEGEAARESFIPCWEFTPPEHLLP